MMRGPSRDQVHLGVAATPPDRVDYGVPMFRVIAGLLCALVLAPAARAATVTPPPPEHLADPSLTTYVERSGPFTIGAYDTLIKTVGVKTPPVAGAVVGMDVRLVDEQGNVIPQWIAMLH